MAHPPDTPLCTPANHSLMSKPDPCLCMPIKKPISEHHLISYYIKGFCRKTCLKNKRKTMRGEVFWGLKNPEKLGASGGSAPWTPPARCPWTKRAPGPHAVKTLRSLRSLHLDTNNFYSAPDSASIGCLTFKLEMFQYLANQKHCYVTIATNV